MKHELYEMVCIPDELAQTVQRGIENGKKIRQKRRRKSILTACGSIAAVFALFVTFCMANPVLASNIPFIGKIFEKVEGNFDYEGDFSERSTHLADTLPDDEIAESDITNETIQTDTLQKLEELYGDTDQDITVIPEEVFCDGTSLYLGLRLTTTDEEGFGFEDASNYADEDRLSVVWRMELRGSVSASGTQQDFHVHLVGEPEDSHTFIGMAKLPVEGLEDAATEVSVRIDSIFWIHFTNKLKNEENPDGEFYPYHILKEGGWDLTVPITIDTSLSHTYEINDIDESGYGISAVYVTPYEIKITYIKPYEQLNEKGYSGGYAVFNENGEFFQYGDGIDGNTEIFAVNGQSTDHLYFYFFEDEFAAVKCHDQADAENGCIYRYELTVD